MRRENGVARGKEESAEANVRTSTCFGFRFGILKTSSLFSNLTALDLLWCEYQQECNVYKDVGDCDNREAQDDRPRRPGCIEKA